MKWSLLILLGSPLGCRDRPESVHTKEGSSPPPASAEHEHERHDELVRRVKLTEAVVREAAIETAPARREALGATLSLPGEIASDPDRTARISSPAAGRIEEVRFKEGENVKKGDVLVVVRVPEIGKVRSAISSTSARAATARTNAERLKRLVAEGLAPEQQALDAQTEADALAVEAKSLREELGALGGVAGGALSISLRAPMAGIVVARNAVVGQPVTPEQALGTIAGLDEVWFLGRVFEKDLGRLSTGAAAEVHLNAYPEEHFRGNVEYLGHEVDPVGRTLTARLRLANERGLLRIGLFGTAEVAIPSERDAAPKLVVPRAAVTEVANKTAVFVAQAPTEFELHEVTLGREAPGKVEVLAGLREGEPVVTRGVFTLKSVVLKGSFAEEEH
ncbi:MAG TPA: efflux RND transporter periplasmic adaptor subunit [Polyangiaceae bacterium]